MNIHGIPAWAFFLGVICCIIGMGFAINAGILMATQDLKRTSAIVICTLRMMGASVAFTLFLLVGVALTQGSMNVFQGESVAILVILWRSFWHITAFVLGTLTAIAVSKVAARYLTPG